MTKNSTRKLQDGTIRTILTLDAAARRLENRSDPSAAWLANYRPAAVPTSEWDGPIGAFVRLHAARLADIPPQAYAKYVRDLAQITLYAQGRGDDLDIEKILHPDTVESFVWQLKASDGTRATVRAALRQIGPQLTRKAPWKPIDKPVRRRKKARPYTESEMQTIVRDIRRQATSDLGLAGRGLVALGAGAGIVPPTNLTIRGPHVEDRDGYVAIREPEQDRLVVVRYEFEEEVLELAALAGDRPLLGTNTGKNAGNSLASQLVIDGGRLKVDTRRLQSTWRLAVLNAVHFGDVLDAVGVKLPGAFDDFAPDLKRRGEIEVARLLRGGS